MLIKFGLILLCGVIYGQYYPPPPAAFPFFYHNQSIVVNNFNKGNQFGSNNTQCLPVKPTLIGAHNLIVGCPYQNDTLLYKDQVDKPARMLSWRQKIINYPDAPSLFRRHNITAIRCYDLIGNDRGGQASIMRGGVGQAFVKIHLSSMQRNRGIRFNVEIYGRQ